MDHTFPKQIMDEASTIDVKDLHNVTLSSIATPFAISWSEDKKISVITTTALHIIEVCPSPSFKGPGISIKRTMIKPFDDKVTEYSGIDTETLIYKLDQPDAYNMILDCQLAPNLSSTKPVEARIKHAVWSPPGMFQEQRCLLACLNNFGSVKIYAPQQHSWCIVIDISSTWMKYCKSHWPPIKDRRITMIKDPQQIYEILKVRTDQLCTTALIWSTLITRQEKYSFLVLGQMNGQVIIWKLTSLNVNHPVTTNLIPALIIDAKLRRITALHWINWGDGTVSLIVANFEGVIKLIRLSMIDDDISLIDMADVWTEKDRMQVLCISCLPAELNNEHRIFAVTKQSFVIVFLLQKDKIIAKCHQLIGNLNVTGLEVVDNESFFVTTFSGYMCLLHVSFSKTENLSLEVKELCTNINWKNVACYGVTTGIKRGIWAIATSICKLYDHLVIRRPANIIFFYLPGMTDPMKNLISNESGRLTDQWEFLEIIRIQCLKKSLDLYHDFMDNPGILERLRSYQLQTELWFARISLIQAEVTHNFERHRQLEKYIHQIEQLLYCRHACVVVTKFSFDLQYLSEEQLLTLYLMRTWLQTWLQAENHYWDSLRDTVRSKLELPVPENMPQRELCSLCYKEVIVNISWRYAVCQTGHRLKRCSWTLRQCYELPYLLCRVCPTIALANNDLNEESVCVLCDSNLVLDDRIKILQLEGGSSQSCERLSQEFAGDTPVSQECQTAPKTEVAPET